MHRKQYLEIEMLQVKLPIYLLTSLRSLFALLLYWWGTLQREIKKMREGRNIVVKYCFRKLYINLRMSELFLLIWFGSLFYVTFSWFGINSYFNSTFLLRFNFSMHDQQLLHKWSSPAIAAIHQCYYFSFLNLLKLFQNNIYYHSIGIHLSHTYKSIVS